MDKISGNLIQLSDQLDQAGQTKCANVVDDLLKSRSLHKVAQYVGVIGYVLKQNRAMGNCIRKKRLASSGPMQEVIMDCLSEYQDGQSYGNNEWTSKYAEVIQHLPTKFASTHVDFLNVIAEENNLSKHIDNVKKAKTILLKHDIQDSFINEVLANLDNLEQGIKEGDDAHRPFKVAAPNEGYEPEQRGSWSRFWSPSFTRRGKDKDAQYEMDNVLESIMNVSSTAQQIRSNIFRLRSAARGLSNKQLVDNINGLSASDWNATTARIQNIGQVLSALRESSPNDPSIFEPSEILSDLSGNVKNVHDQISRVQRNMYNLRLRDAVKGRNTTSATDEYADLDQALSRLYANPLDEKSLYYSQKLHGRLEDALNSRQTSEPGGYNDWADMPIENPSEIPGVDIDNMNEIDQPTSLPVDRTPESVAQSVAKDISSIADPAAVQTFVEILRNVVLPSNMKPESREFFNIVKDSLDQQAVNPVAEYSETMQSPETRTSIVSVKILRKMADALEPLDEEISKLLSEYLQEAEEALPEFPEICSILKEEAASRLKIIQKKAGRVIVNT